MTLSERLSTGDVGSEHAAGELALEDSQHLQQLSKVPFVRMDPQVVGHLDQQGIPFGRGVDRTQVEQVGDRALQGTRESLQ